MKPNLEEIKAMLGKISKWPWQEDFQTHGPYRGKPMGFVFDKDKMYFVCKELDSLNCNHDMKFIAATPSTIASLVEEVERLRASLEKIKSHGCCVRRMSWV